MNTVIVDLDNCIADDAWRIPHIRWQKKDLFERYHNYHLLAGWDQCWHQQLIEPARARRERLVVFTARPTAYAAITEEWLRRNNVPFAALIMRNNDDHRPSVDLKRAMLGWLEELYDIPLRSVVAAYDDRADVVSMYIEQGIPAQIRAIHGLCAYTPPTTLTKESKQ